MDGFAIDVKMRVIPHGEIKFALFFIEKAEYSTEHQPNHLEQDDVRLLYKQMFPLAVYGNQESLFTWALRSGQQQELENWTPQTRPSQSSSKPASTHQSDESSAISFSTRHPEQVTDFPALQNDDVQSNSSAHANEFSTFPPMTEAVLASSVKCLACGTSKSPEWRRGPDGKKSLCNACGLRFSRETLKARKKG